MHVETRINLIVNRLNRTKVEREADLAAEKLAREKMDRLAARQAEFNKV